MLYQNLHPWNINPKQAQIIQDRLKNKIRLKKLPIERISIIAGVDVHYKSKTLYGVIVNFKFPSLEMMEIKKTSLKISFPYIPGLLSFREGPCILKTFEKLKVKPDVIIFDGQGIAHPKQFGIASHLGLWLQKPTIGCAKSRLVGIYEEPKIQKGSYSYLTLHNKIIGAVVRTKDRVKPMFVSPGFEIDLLSSIYIILECSKGYRIPEPLRKAHILAKKYCGTRKL
jgi:deoxyribonuclease V